jgi:hypothetical protein
MIKDESRKNEQIVVLPCTPVCNVTHGIYTGEKEAEVSGFHIY